MELLEASSAMPGVSLAWGVSITVRQSRIVLHWDECTSSVADHKVKSGTAGAYPAYRLWPQPTYAAHYEQENHKRTHECDILKLKQRPLKYTVNPLPSPPPLISEMLTNGSDEHGYRLGGRSRYRMLE